MSAKKPVQLNDQQKKMVENNLLLAYKIATTLWKASRYVRRISLDDAKQAACCGLIRAAQKFKQELNYRFSTYAYVACRREVFAAADKGGTISLPDLRGKHHVYKGKTCATGRMPVDRQALARKTMKMLPLNPNKM